jgi:predicted HAD superfamily Cof-like phosphohydrolase
MAKWSTPKSNDWASDINAMHEKFGVKKWFEANKDNKDLMDKYLKFRLAMCKEELDETMDAIDARDPEEIVDGLIDMCVFAIGTLDVFGVDANRAWDAVYGANMAKNVGIKEGRPNPFGLPDLMKPEGWEAPSHEGNHGDVKKAL